MSRMSSKEALRLGLISEAEASAIGKPKGNKYGVSTPERRTHNGRVYASRSEMLYTQHLEALQSLGQIVGFAEQPRVQLGPDTVYKPDFVVIADATHFVDVKGAEPREFIKIKKLWAKYMRVPLLIVKQAIDGFKIVEKVGGP